MCFDIGSRHLGCWGQNTSRIQNKGVYAALCLQASAFFHNDVTAPADTMLRYAPPPPAVAMHAEVALITEDTQYHEVEFSDVQLRQGQGIAVDLVITPPLSDGLMAPPSRCKHGGGGVLFGNHMLVFENTKRNLQAVARRLFPRYCLFSYPISVYMR